MGFLVILAESCGNTMESVIWQITQLRHKEGPSRETSAAGMLGWVGSPAVRL